DSSAPVWPAGASLTASAITPHSLTLSWPQATDDVSVVHHHVFQDGVKIGTLDAQTTTFSATGLSPWTDYEFNVKGEDQAGNLSDIGLLLTVKTADDSSPTWFPGQLTITAVTPTSLTLLWPNATDDAAVGSWVVTINGSELTTVQANMTSLDVVDLAPWTDYVFTVRALDEAGNASTPLEQAVKTPDNMPPSWSQDAVITASNIASTNLTLLWPEANDDVGVTSYIVSVDGGVVSTVDGQTTTAAISNLIPGATVLFQVRAVDAAGNKGTSLGLTLTMPDGGPPTWEEATLTAVPSGLDAALTWQAATDDIGVVAYRVFVDGQNMLEVTETQAVVSGLMPETTYTFKVEAGDAAGNWSTDGPSATATTMKVHDPGFKRLTKYQFNRTLADLTGYIWNVGCSHDYVDHWACGEGFFRDADSWFDHFNRTVQHGSWGKYNHGYPDDQHVHSPDAYHGGFKRLDTKLYQTHISSWVTGAMNIAGNSMEKWVGALRILRPCKAANDAGLTNYASDDELYEACMSNFIHDFGKRAYRRPVTSDEHSYLMETYAEAMVDYAQTGEDGFALYARGLRNVVATILLSPQFIYRIELGDAEGKLTGWELASRLSYHFWDTMPDDELFAAVEDGSLSTPEGYATQVERLFSDPKAQRSIDGFYRDYFRVQDLKDPQKQDYPGSSWGWIFYHEGGKHGGETEKQEGRVPWYGSKNLSNGVVWSMEQELVNLGRWFTFNQPGTFEEMFRSNLHFMQCPDEPDWDGVMRCSGAGPWSQYTYEIEGTCTDFDDCLEKEWIDTGNGWDGISPPITLPEPERAGLLTRMPLLVHDTHVARPIRRGLAIREMLLCDPVPPPENCDVVKPPNVTGMCESAAGQTGVSCNDDMQCEPGETCVGWDKEVTMTVREKAEALTEVPGTTCANCHSTFINGFGHALGHFSSLGKYWEKEHLFTNHKSNEDPDEFWFYHIEPPENWPEIDTTGTTILDGQWVSFDGPHEVADLLVDSGKMEWCWSREYFRYAIGRFDTEADADSIEQMAESLRTGASLADAYKSIAHTQQFKTLVAKPKASSLGGTP
ncbi:MAG: fibronectin type III domain-containing protein, partial [Myxococcota bacterium]|nr:fibronectin type III domain-containing protein [Myxococcota bacterium]